MKAIFCTSKSKKSNISVVVVMVVVGGAKQAIFFNSLVTYSTVCLKSIANTSHAVPGSLRSSGHRFQRRLIEGQMQ